MLEVLFLIEMENCSIWEKETLSYSMSVEETEYYNDSILIPVDGRTKMARFYCYKDHDNRDRVGLPISLWVINGYCEWSGFNLY